MKFTRETSKTTKRFWNCFEGLPAHIQQRAVRRYSLFLEDPAIVSFEKKGEYGAYQVCSADIDGCYRALGLVKDGVVKWFWIGHHDEYERLLRRLS